MGDGQHGPTHPGIFVRHVLDERNLTQAWLARATDRTQKHISMLLRGKARLTSEVALEVARALDLDPVHLMTLQAEHDLRHHHEP